MATSDPIVKLGLPLVLILLFLTLAVNNVRGNGSFSLDYKWRSRNEAPLQFWLLTVGYVAAAAVMALLLFAEMGWHLPIKL